VSSGYGMARKARSYLDHEEYAYLGFMYTLPEYRGKGINQRILRALQDWAKSMGLIELRLTVYEDNLPAVKAYEKAGFRKHIVEMRLREN
ncbi:MAG: GNAT family N-acetyltransferase, partial [Eudoraea sp.]|nr:GNAT family N-acetyltransferase [Eudoraea sp.]